MCKIKIKLLFVLCLMVASFGQDGLACTTFQLVQGDQVFVGKNYDYMFGDGLIVVNKSGLTKTAIPSPLAKNDKDQGEPANWTAKYGSVTINQYGRELPAEGMNEAGLVVQHTGLFGKGKYFPEPDDRPSIYMLQWLQYQLDNCASVAEVIASDSSLRIRPKKGVHIHFLVADKNGNCAVIEFIDGKMVTYENDKLPYKVITNSTYGDSIGFFKRNEIPNPDRFKSIERFACAAKMLEAYSQGIPKEPEEYSFEILKNVAWSAKREKWTTNTQWSIVYDIKNLRIHLKTRENPEIRHIDLKSFDLTCQNPVKIMDINAQLSGNISDKFMDYTRQANRKMVETAFNKTVYLPKLPEKVFDRIADYPDTNVCSE